MPSRLGEPRKRSGAARFAGPVAPPPVTPAEEEEADELAASRLDGNTPPQPEAIDTSATVPQPVAPFPAPLIASSPSVTAPQLGQYESALLTPSRLAAKTAKTEKRAMAIRLTVAAKDRLSELERSLERAGFTPHQASASEIIITLLETADISDLRERLSRRFHKGKQ